jgi:hypothetical protein
MAKVNHNISAPNDGLGDQLRTAFGNQNNMNTELYDNKVDKVTGKGLSTNDYSNIDKAKVDAIASGAEANVQSDWLQEDNTQDDFIKNKPPELFSSVGSFHYVDLATKTTPLSVVANVEKKITNDTLDPETNVLNAPYGISSMWDAVNNQLNFSQTAIGDLITIIPAVEVTTTAANQEFSIYIKMAIGSGAENTKQVYNGSLKTIGTIIVNPTRDFSIDTVENKDFPAEIFIVSDANASVKSGDLDIRVVRKNINIVSSDDSKQNKLVAGANITIDITDPLNPVISSAASTTDISGKVDKVAGKSLILDTEITRLAGVTNQDISGKQNTLVSGTNIKTINGTTLLGSGDIVVSAGAADPAQIMITTTVSITTDTLDNAGKTQKEKNVIIDNGVSAINITVNGGTNFMASYLKHGTGSITFVQGTGRTLALVDSTAVFNGAVGSTATISSVGTKDYLRISNAV